MSNKKSATLVLANLFLWTVVAAWLQWNDIALFAHPAYRASNVLIWVLGLAVFFKLLGKIID